MTALKKKASAYHIPECRSDRVFRVVLAILVMLLMVIFIYPMYFVLMASFSDPLEISTGALLLYPKGFTLAGYQNILQNNSIWIGYRNSLLYMLVGTPIALLITASAAFAFSRDDLPFRKVLNPLYMFTMYFGGGLIPLYLVVRNLGLNRNPLVVILLGLFSVYNMIIARTYFATSIPYEIQEAAMIDGCSIPRLFFEIMLPLAKPVLCVLGLYIAVSYWNSYFYAMMFLTDEKFYPLQLVLRRILLTGTSIEATAKTVAQANAGDHTLQSLTMLAKYCVIVVSIVPMLILYPLVQRYFIKGVMIGAVKG